MDPEVQCRARKRYAGLHQPLAQIHEDIVDEALVAGLGDQPIENLSALHWQGAAFIQRSGHGLG
ncbi:hypothetical protein D3C86_2212340 [compost metagenome]